MKLEHIQFIQKKKSLKNATVVMVVKYTRYN